MKKSVSKRIIIKKSGKILRRKMATDHFRVRKNQNNIRGKRLKTGLNYPVKKILNY